MSVTKSVTALLAGAVAGAGLLDLDAPVVDHVPEAEGSAFGDATVRHLLDMTTGIGFVEDYTPNDDVRAYRQSTGWYPREGSPHDLHDYLLTIPRGTAHGGRFHYVSPNTDMLGWVVERAAGEPYADALSRYLWAPLGAEQDADVTLDPAGSPRAAGGLCITPRDMARLGQLVVEDGAGVVPAAFVDDLRSGGDPALWAAGEWAEWLPGGAYRSCWYQPRTDPGRRDRDRDPRPAHLRRSATARRGRQAVVLAGGGRRRRRHARDRRRPRPRRGGRLGPWRPTR